jgi:hypothetical protein
MANAAASAVIAVDNHPNTRFRRALEPEIRREAAGIAGNIPTGICKSSPRSAVLGISFTAAAYGSASDHSLISAAANHGEGRTILLQADTVVNFCTLRVVSRASSGFWVNTITAGGHGLAITDARP